jgi:hypothetical protein
LTIAPPWLAPWKERDLVPNLANVAGDVPGVIVLNPSAVMSKLPAVKSMRSPLEAASMAARIFLIAPAGTVMVAMGEGGEKNDLLHVN